jgi:hypothetical protein
VGCGGGRALGSREQKLKGRSLTRSAVELEHTVVGARDSEDRGQA